MKRMHISYALAVAVLFGLTQVGFAQDETAPAETPAVTEEAAPAADEGAAPAVVDPNAVEATVEDLERQINLPPAGSLGRETDENLNAPANVFANEAERKRLLGEKPRFIYFPQGADPMIIPWVRNQIIAAELLADAQALLAKALNTNDRTQAQRALDLAEEVIKKYSDTPQLSDANKLAGDARRFLSKEGSSDVKIDIPDGQQVKLPAWIESNTTGVIIDRENPSASILLVGDNILKAGDKVPRFPAVTIKELRPQKVVYEYMGQEFLVSVKSR